MAQENVEIVHQVLEAWNRRAFDDAVRVAHEDVELHFIGGFADLIGEEFDGREGIVRFWRDILGTLGGQVTVEATLDAGERVAINSTVEGAGAESGAPAGLRLGRCGHSGTGR